MTDAWDGEDQAIARALDAGSDEQTDEADDVAVDEYREVLAQLPIAEVTPSPDLEDRMVAAALERRAAAAPVIDHARGRRRVRRVRIAALAAAVAAVVVGGVVLSNRSSEPPAPSGRVSLATVRRADVDALLRAPGSRTGVLGAIGKVVLSRDGNGAVYDLAVAKSLGVGLVSSGGTTVIGPARPKGGVIAFVVDHPERVRSVTLVQQGIVIASVDLSSR